MAGWLGIDQKWNEGLCKLKFLWAGKIRINSNKF